MPASANVSNTSLFDRFAKTMPPFLIALSAAGAAYEFAPVISTYLQSEATTPIASVAPSVPAEPIATTPPTEIKPEPRVQEAAAPPSYYRVAKHHHRRRRHGCVAQYEHVSRLGSDSAPITLVDDAGDVPRRLTLVDAITHLFRSFGRRG